VRVGWRLGVVLVLLGVAAGVLHMPRPVTSAVNPASLFVVPPSVGAWTSVDGVAEDILPLDPNEKLSVRRTYRRGSQVVWVSVALFVGQNDETRQASINKIYPQRNVSLVERLPVTVSLSTPPTGSVKIPAVLVHQESRELLVAYWHQIGNRIFGNEYRFRLALMRGLLFERRVDTLLVRIAAPAGRELSTADALAAVSELGFAVHAALSEEFGR
jgi:EpsI family protein